jgi:hypothetical protein
MYSAGKTLVQQEKAHLATDDALSSISVVLKPAEAHILTEIIKQLKPLIEARQREAQIKAQLQADTELINVLQNLSERLLALETKKSANAEQERIVLDKLLAVL